MHPDLGRPATAVPRPSASRSRSAASTASHITASASAARRSHRSHAPPLGGRIRSVSCLIVASNFAPITSGNSAHTLQHPAVLVPLHPQLTAPPGAPGLPRPWASLLARHASEIRRRHVRSPLRQLRIGLLVGELHHLVQLLRTELPRVQPPPTTAGNDSNARAVSSFSRTVRADSPSDPDRRVDPAPLVEHQQDRVLLGLQPPHLGHHLATARFQPLRRVGAHHLEAVGDVQHPTIKSWGYDSYAADSAALRRGFSSASVLRMVLRARDVVAGLRRRDVAGLVGSAVRRARRRARRSWPASIRSRGRRSRWGATAVAVTNLTPAGAEPHDLELTPDQIDEVLDAKVVFELGQGFQPAVEQAAEQRERPDRAAASAWHEGSARLARSRPHGRIVRTVQRELTKADPKGRAVYARERRRVCSASSTR